MRTISSLFLVMVLVTSCEFSGKKIKGNGNLASEEKNVGPFTGISTSGSIDIIVSDGPAHALKIEADENLLEYVVVNNKNGTVKVYTKEGFNLNPVRHIRVYATAPSFSNLDVSGSAKIKSNGKIKGENLHTEVSGSGDIILDVDTPTMEADIAGSGSATISGTTRNFSASVSGSGEIRCYNLLSEHTEIDIAGSGDAEVYASKSLDVDVAGAGNVRYKGNPSIKQSIAGAGSVRKAD